jgi:hypothetical protein
MLEILVVYIIFYIYYIHSLYGFDIVIMLLLLCIFIHFYTFLDTLGQLAIQEVAESDSDCDIEDLEAAASDFKEVFAVAPKPVNIFLLTCERIVRVISLVLLAPSVAYL